MGTEDDVFVFEFTRTPAAFREALMGDGYLMGVANELTNTLGGQPGVHPVFGRYGPYVFVRPHKYHQVMRFLTDVGVRRGRPAQDLLVWDAMPPRFVIVDVDLGSWVEGLIATLPERHRIHVKQKIRVSLDMVRAHFELQDYLAHAPHECVAGHLLTWP